MLEAATIATAFLGSFEASFERLWAYSAAVMPGVTIANSVSSCSLAKASEARFYILQLSTGADEFHVQVDQIAARRPTLKCSGELRCADDSLAQRKNPRTFYSVFLTPAIVTCIDMISYLSPKG